jgi:hypothetical protein
MADIFSPDSEFLHRARLCRIFPGMSSPEITLANAVRWRLTIAA